mgnify:CR=1 FL=1
MENLKTDLLDLRRMDCMDLMRGMEDNAFDLAIVDPPYGLNDWNKRGSNKKKYTKNYMDLDKIQGWESTPPKDEYFRELKRVSNNQIIWGGNHFLDYLGSTKEMLIWDKCIRGMHFNDCELAWSSGVREACRIFSLSANQLHRIHPTQKPVALYNWLLQNYAKPGDRIIDTHLGSGSIAIACHYKGFHLTGAELDQDYFDGMVKRVRHETSQVEFDLGL